MDRQTRAAYDLNAAAFAEDWHGQPAPVDLQEVVERFFVRGGNSADIGCGGGREVAWLNANGFPAAGFDACEGLLDEARRRHPAGYRQAERHSLSELARHRGRRSSRRPGKALRGVRCRTRAGGTEDHDGIAR